MSDKRVIGFPTAAQSWPLVPSALMFGRSVVSAAEGLSVGGADHVLFRDGLSGPMCRSREPDSQRDMSRDASDLGVFSWRKNASAKSQHKSVTYNSLVIFLGFIFVVSTRNHIWSSFMRFS